MMTTHRLTLEEAKRRLPIVPDLWLRLALPGEVPRLGRKFTSPFRPDKHPSCTVFVGRDGFQRFSDLSQNVTTDAIGFLALATGLEKREACRRFLELAGGGSFRDTIVAPQQTLSAPPRSAQHAGKPKLPADLHQGSHEELTQVALLRGLSVAGVTLASERGLLCFGTVCRRACWLVLDGTCQLAQARRMDGQPFPAFEDISERKAHTIKGGRQGWPLGVCEAAGFPAVLLTEGGPDLLAACHFIAAADRERELAPVSILGAGNRIPVEALPLFAGKRVRIFPHAGTAGADAAARWAWELEIEGNAGATVDAFRVDGLFQADGQPVSDLNDLARMHPASQPSREDLLP